MLFIEPLPCCCAVPYQIRAIIEAAINVSKEGVKVHPHIMVPLVGIEDELTGQAKIINDVAQQVRFAFICVCH